VGIDLSSLAALLMAIGSLVGVFITLRRVRGEIAVERVRINADVSQAMLDQARQWLAHQGDYVSTLRVDISDLRERIREMNIDLERQDRTHREQVRALEAEMERRDDVHRQYVRYLLRNLAALTEQVCETAGQKPRVISMTYEEFIRDL
jgi:hypothetical protein